MKHQCPRKECNHGWSARVKKPKQCPRCKRYLPLVKYQGVANEKKEKKQ